MIKQLKRTKGEFNPHNWMIFGGCGFLGKQLIDLALNQGFSPIVAGQSVTRLRALAKAYQLPWCLLDFSQPDQVRRSLSGVELVYCACHLEQAYQLASIAAGLNLIIVIPGPVSDTVTSAVDKTKTLVFSDVAFHRAIFDSLMAIARAQMGDIRKVHVLALGLPIRKVGYLKQFLSWQLKGGKLLSQQPQSKGHESLAWREALLKATAHYQSQAFGSQMNPSQWWQVSTAESISILEPTVSFYTPIGLKSRAAISVLVKASEYFSVDYQSVAELLDKPMLKKLSGTSDHFNFIHHRLWSSTSVPKRSALWLVVEGVDKKCSVFGFETLPVYDFTAYLGLIVINHCLNHHSVSVHRQQCGSGVVSMVDLFGPDLITQVPDSLKLGNFKSGNFKTLIVRS